MAHISVISKEYNDDQIDEDIIGYILNPNKTKSGLVGGIGVLMTTPGHMAQQLRAVRAVYHKDTGKRIHHFIVSFASEEYMTPQDAYFVGWLIAKVLTFGHQVVFAVHEDTDHLHLHFVINSVNIQTGNKWSMTQAGLSWLQEYVQKCVLAVYREKEPVYPQNDQEMYHLLKASQREVIQRVEAKKERAKG